MELKYTLIHGGIRVERVLDPAAVVMIPEEIDGQPVTELGDYVLAGSVVEELHLPPGMKKIGAYAFYNCERLKRISCYSRIHDLGTGMFAGGKGAEFLEMHQFEGETSYFKDMLAELHQTLRVRIHGAQEARLIFPEYFEEWVENTPARILMTQTHGCGHRYRYCFRGREFQYRDYDDLFPHVQVQENEALVMELALGRILYPYGLTEENRLMYQHYVRRRWEAAGRLIVETDCRKRGMYNNLDRGLMPWFAKHYVETVSQVQKLIGMAQSAGDTEAVSWLMDFMREKRRAGEDGEKEMMSETPVSRKKRRFEL